MSEQYVKKTMLQHIKLRPEMYVGSTSLKMRKEYVASKLMKIEQKEIMISPAFLRIFIEPISNIIDNFTRSEKSKTPCRNIQVNIDIKTGEVVFRNDGLWIPITKNKTENCWNHTLIFGQLLTSENYDDTSDRYNISGKNGIGVKLSCVFSTKFTVRGVDPQRKLKFKQTWRDGMTIIEDPIIEQSTKTKGFTEIRFFPDFKYFGLDGFSADHICLLRKYVIDMTMIAQKASVVFNGDNIDVDSLVDYANMYATINDEKREVLYTKTKDCEVLLTTSFGQDFEHVSFANGISTPLGGVHVQTWGESFFRPLMGKLNKPKKPQLSIKDIKKCFRLFVVAKVCRPEFESQEKRSLEGPAIQSNVTQSHIKTVMKWSIIDKLRDMIRAKELLAMKKTQRKKKGHVKIDGLDPANNEGGKLGHKCTLILVEGLSAKTYAVSGIDVGVNGKKGRDWYGIMALRGKCVSPTTSVRLWNGMAIFAKDVVVGDILINDLGEPTTVQRLFSGKDDMYEINQTMGSSYTVNSRHTLSLRVSGHRDIVWDDQTNEWKMGYFDKKKMLMNYKYVNCDDNPFSNHYDSFKTKEDGHDEIMTFRDTIDEDDTLDIDIADYIALPSATKTILKGFKLSEAVQWPKKDVFMDPYVLGMWLGDGGHSGWGSTSGSFTTSLREKLAYYDLLDSKSIPDEYIINDADTRRQLLAGFIDTDGGIFKDGRIELSLYEKHEKMLDSLVYIARSLGIACAVDMINLKMTMSGDNCKYLPTNLNRLGSGKLQFRQELSSDIGVCYKGRGDYVGFEVDETNRFLLGDFTVTHNCLNVRNAKASSIANNTVISDIIKSLGVEYDVDYTVDSNYKKLRYGQVMILTDQDCDGIHISGLIQNMFHHLFPSLMDRKSSFIVSMQTPIIRVFQKGKKDRLFYDEPTFHNWHEKFMEQKTPPFIHWKYYKGLGTSDEKCVRETFGKKMIKFYKDAETNDTMNKIFHKNNADLRKVWLSKWSPETSKGIDWKTDGIETQRMSISNFLDDEMIKFSHHDCGRSIPSILDGLKESHRKVLFSCFKKKLSYRSRTLKVAQLSGYVAEHSGYHHGEQNLFDTITKMAWNFIGSNNIPLLHADGQFGSRIQMGKDAASARYIFTKLGSLTRLIYRPEDDVLLPRRMDDGDLVEPMFYIPIIPMILVNGITAGIGTGYSCSVPCHNPLDIVDCIKTWLDNSGDIFIEEDGKQLSILQLVTPWYKGWTGTIQESTKREKSWVSTGRCIVTGNNKYLVNELPIGMSTDKFKDFLENQKVDKKIKNYKNYSKTANVHFEIQTTKDNPTISVTSMKLNSHLSTSNMVAFTENDKICRFGNVDEIINYFCGVRWRWYKKRKQYQLNELGEKISKLSNKVRWLREIMNGDIELFNVNKAGKRVAKSSLDLVRELIDRKYDPFTKETVDTDESTEDESVDDDDVDDESMNKKGYSYLLNMKFSSITKERITKLDNEVFSLSEKKRVLQTKSEKAMWISDLDEFVDKYVSQK